MIMRQLEMSMKDVEDQYRRVAFNVLAATRTIM